MFTRYLSAISTGTVITFGLLFLMQFLITMDAKGSIVESPRHPLVWAEVRDPKPVQKQEEPIKRETLTKIEQRPEWTYPNASGPVIGVSYTDPGRPRTVLPEMPKYVDGPLVGLVKVQPAYPARMAQQGISGYVIVEFDVMANGQVRNARIVRSSHKGFENAALQAALRMKFKPRVVDGVPLLSEGIQNKFTFEME